MMQSKGHVMNDLDQMLKDVLGDEAVKSGDVSIWEEMVGLYSGKQGWLAVVMSLEMIALFVACVLFAVCFFELDETASPFEVGAWGLGVLLCGLASGMLKVFLFQMMHRNTILREVNRLEVAVRLLAKKGEAG